MVFRTWQCDSRRKEKPAVFDREEASREAGVTDPESAPGLPVTCQVAQVFQGWAPAIDASGLLTDVTLPIHSLLKTIYLFIWLHKVLVE